MTKSDEIGKRGEINGRVKRGRRGRERKRWVVAVREDELDIQRGRISLIRAKNEEDQGFVGIIKKRK